MQVNTPKPPAGGKKEQHQIKLKAAEHQRIRTLTYAVHTTGKVTGEPGVKAVCSQQ